MKYAWSHHAASERLPERSGLRRAEVEQRLAQRKYIVNRGSDPAEHHLIWDESKLCLIDVPLIVEGSGYAIIPTIRPVNYGSGYSEWQCAEAERAWRGEEFWQPAKEISCEKLDWVEVLLARTWRTRSGWIDHAELVPILSWPIFDQKIAQTGHEGMLALFHEREFCTTVKNLLERWSEDLPILVGNDTPVVRIKKPGAYRNVPVQFFLLTP